MVIEEVLSLTSWLPVPTIALSTDGVIHGVNHASESKLGLSATEAVGQSLADIVRDPPEKIASYLRMCSRSRQPLPGSITLGDVDGAPVTRHCEGALFRPVGDSNVSVIILTIVEHESTTTRFRVLSEKIDDLNREVGKRTKAEADLRGQNERLVLLGRVANQLLMTDDPEAMVRGVFEEVKEHFALDSCFNSVTAPGEPPRLLSSTGAPDIVTEAICQLTQSVAPHLDIGRVLALNAEDLTRSEEAEAQMARGVGVRSYVAFPLNAHGRFIGILSFASRNRDRFDDVELAFLQTIAHYVTVAYQRLQLIQLLRDADRRKDDFLATLAHELRNPLAPIWNALELMRIADDDPQVIEESRALMERQLQRMVRLIDDLLEISRITRGKIELRRERVGLASVIRNAVEAARPLVDAQGHELTVSLPSEPIALYADPIRLAQVFGNLLDNAAKYSPRGSRIWLDAARDGAVVTVTVRDTGIGIPPSNLSRIFEMFAQIESPLARSHGGLGIGLALVRGLVELHGGSVEVASNGVGSGSTFTVHLPCVSADGDHSKPADDTGHVRSQATICRVLVVDDNRDAADSLTQLLRRLGHEVGTEYDGPAAVLAAATMRPSVVLLDIGLPKMNGYEVAEEIRSQPWGREIVLMALTGWGQSTDKHRAVAAGFDHHLTKPVDPALLTKLLTEVQTVTRRQ